MPNDNWKKTDIFSTERYVCMYLGFWMIVELNEADQTWYAYVRVAKQIFCVGESEDKESIMDIAESYAINKKVGDFINLAHQRKDRRKYDQS
jgi:hypothetical protein